MVFLLVEGKCPHTLGRVVVCSAAKVMHSSCQPEGICGDLACLQALTVPWLRRFPQFVGVGCRPDIKHATSVWGEKGWDEIRRGMGAGSVISRIASALHRVGVSLLTLSMSELAHVGFWVVGSPWARTEVAAIWPASSGWVGSKLPGEKQQQAAALHRVVLLRLGASALRDRLRGVVHQPGRRRAYSGKAKTTISAASRATESLSMR